MAKKIFVLGLLLILVSVPALSHAKDMKPYKIKRLVNQLYEKPKAMDAQRQLSSYGIEVTPYVLPLLKDKNNESARIAALKVLAAVKATSAEPEVVKRLKDHDSRVRQQAAKTLSVIGSKETTVAALKDLMKDPYPNVRYNAIRALARIAPKDEADLFISSLSDYDPRVRMFAVAALGRIKSEKSVPYITQLARDWDPGVRTAVAGALGSIGSKDCLPGLELLMQDPDLSIRILAIKKISELKNVPGVDEPLYEVAMNHDPRIASVGMLSLAEVNKEKALEVAKNRIDDEHTSVQMASIEIIGRMGNKEDKQLLQGLTDAESTKVRRQAEVALEDLDSRT